MNNELKNYMAEIGRKGGKSHRSGAGGKAVWARMSPAQRSKEMKRRAAVREKKRVANCAATVTPSPNPLNSPEHP